MRQQPKRARISGSGTQIDRRLVDPPPIVELKLNLKLFKGDPGYKEILKNPMIKARREQNLLHASNFFCKATLCKVETDEELRL